MRRRRLQDITAADIMATELVTVATTMSLAEAERLLAESDVSGAPVTDHAGRIAGVVSLRDLVARNAQGSRTTPVPWDEGIEPGRAPGSADVPEAVADEPADLSNGEDELLRMAAGEMSPVEAQDTVADIMTAQVHAVDTDTNLFEIAAAMTRHHIHRVLVRRRGDDEIVGLVSSMDVLRALAGAGRR